MKPSEYPYLSAIPLNTTNNSVLNFALYPILAGIPRVTARNSTPSAMAGSPLHLSVEFCASPPPYAARWLHGDRIYTPGSQYGGEVIAYGFTVRDLNQSQSFIQPYVFLECI